MKLKSVVPLVAALAIWGCTANHYEEELQSLGAGCCGFRVFESAALSDGRIAVVAEDEDDIFRAYILSNGFNILTELTVPGEFFSTSLHVDQFDNIHIYNHRDRTFYSWTPSGTPLGALVRGDTAGNTPWHFVSVDTKGYIGVSYLGSLLVSYDGDTVVRVGGPYQPAEEGVNSQPRQGHLLQTDGKLIFVPWYADRYDLQIYNGSGSLLNSVNIGALFESPVVSVKAAAIDGDRVLLSAYYEDSKGKPKTGVVALSPEGVVKGVWREEDIPGLKKFRKNAPNRVFWKDKLIAFGDITKNNPKREEVTVPPTP